VRRGRWVQSICCAALLGGAGISQAQQPPDPARWEEDVRAFEAADRKRPPAPGGILFAGSSSIRLWTTLQRDFPRFPVINRGVGGSQIPEITALAHRIVFPYRPRLIVFYCGSNDLANGRTPRQVIEDFREFVARVGRELPYTRIAFVSIASNPARAALIPQFTEVNEAIDDIARGDPRVDYVDVNSRMLGPGGAIRPGIFVDDQLHMNRKGYRIWRDVIAEYLTRALASE
jgi:lysophospholipase L1-like esterase